MKNETRTIYRRASAIIPYRLKKADGSFQDLSGYTVKLLIKRALSDTTPLYTGNAVVRGSDHTWADFFISKGTLDFTGSVFRACVEAENTETGDYQPDAFTLRLEDHA